ncbi:MAG: alpha-mannosidase [Pleomorphochaeta sp.]
MKWHAQIISHTHWDREWYLNSKYTNEWLVPFFDSLLDMFEKEADYQFVLDGQLSMIDDYFEELKKLKRPIYKYKNLIRKYSKEGRLFVGPYYLQPDWQLLSEESLVRNLVIGTKMANEIGQCMNVGWLLDNFGQISQTSQIHKEAGLRGLYVWRGVEMDPENVQSEFIWESPDGTRLPSVYLLNSYRNVMRLAEYSDIMKDRIYNEVEKLQPFMTTKNILMMNGYDQEMVPDNIQPFLKSNQLDSENITVTQSNPEKYLDSVLNENPSLITLKGDLYSGRFISVFPGVMSARMYLKLQNDEAQKTIEKYAEPLNYLNYLINDKYNEVSFINAWKLLLKNHPHDSICGVSIDDVHTDMEERFRDFHYIVDNLLEQSIKDILNNVDTSTLNDQNYFVYNPSVYDRKEIVNIEGVDKIVDAKALGISLIKDNSLKGDVEKTDNIITNSKIEVTINSNGTIDLFDKETNTTYKNLGYLEESGDAGDEYNYSYPDRDKYFYSTDSEANITYSVVNDKKVEVIIEYSMKLPKSLTMDRKDRVEDLLEMPVRTTISIEAYSSVVKFNTTILNTVKDHIVKAVFPTNIESSVSYAGSPFDVVERPIHIDDYDESMIPSNVRKVIVGAREAKPNTIFLGRELIDINDGDKGLSVLSKGLPEYTVKEENNGICLTLFRGVDWVANDINTRIGDAGPLIYTPEAECLRQMTFDYAIYPHKNGYEEGGVVKEADKFNSDLKVLTTNKHKGSLNSDFSLLSISDTLDNIRVTSIKKADSSQSMLVRMYNSGENDTKVSLNSIHQLKSVKKTDFLENEKESYDIIDNSVTFDVSKKEIVTLVVDIDNTLLKTASNQIDENAISDIYDLSERYTFEGYESVELVTKEDIERERARAESLLENIDNPLYRRTALEAQLSATLTQDRYDELKTYKLGWGLNEARVKRRVFDYIQDILSKRK